jgi:hypothetical protein
MLGIVYMSVFNAFPYIKTFPCSFDGVAINRINSVSCRAAQRTKESTLQAKMAIVLGAAMVDVKWHLHEHSFLYFFSEKEATVTTHILSLAAWEV